MPIQRQRPAALPEPAVAAVRFLAEHGYEATTAGELADAVGMSRSTFFRRFGSKDDVIFADHDIALEWLEEFLGSTELPAADALARGAVDVQHLLTRNTEAARLRSELLRQNPALRERELVITHRYERVFAAYLARVAPAGTPSWAPTALAAAVVAVHNANLRHWLRDPDPRIITALDSDLRQLATRFSPWFAAPDQSTSRVVVAAFDADSAPDEVIRVLTEQFGR